MVFFVPAIFVYSQERGLRTCAMTVKSYGVHIDIGFWSEGKNMQISFFPCGVNQLMGIGKISYFASLSDYRNNLMSGEFTSCTDWVGPYIVCSKAALGAGIPQKFTGGWHGTNGDGTGKPTAMTAHDCLLVDGTEVKVDRDCCCTQADLYVTNLIRGYDCLLDSSYLLKEVIHYCIKPEREIDVGVQTEALDDAVIQKYYGLQSQNLDIFDQVSYWAGDQLLNTGLNKSDNCCKTNDHINTILLTGDQHQLKLILDTTEGIGTFTQLGENKPKAFSASYGKSYFNLINGKDLLLQKGEKMFWRGIYLWD